MTIGLLIVIIEGLIVCGSCYLMYKPRPPRTPPERSCCGTAPTWTPPFCASDYLERIEKVHLAILEAEKPVDQTIILWWGLDGLRIAPDGTTAWISRKTPAPQSFAVPPWVPMPPPMSSYLYANNQIVECCSQPSLWSSPLPSHWLPTPPPISGEADVAAVVSASCVDQTAALQMQLDRLRTEQTITKINSSIINGAQNFNRT